MKDKLVNFIKTMIFSHLFNQKLNNKVWIFSSTNNKEFNYNSKYLFIYVLENEKDITPYYVINDDNERERLKRKYGESFFIETKTLEGIKTVLSAGVWFTSAGLPLYGTKFNNNRQIINLWHGVPLKKIVLLENNYSKLKKIYFKTIFSKNYSYILTTSKNLIHIMKDSFGVDERKVKVWGQPRNDVIFKNVNKDILESLSLYNDKYNKLILYAPTYRDDEEICLFPFEDFDKNKLEEFLEINNILIYIHTHMNENGNISKYLGKRIRILEDNKIDDIMDILNIFNILITDYSSIYIDFLLLKKPIIFLPYDKKKYLSKRGFNFDYDKVTPGHKPETMNEFIGVLEEIFEGKDLYKEDRELVNDIFNEISYPCSKEICINVKKILEIK